MMNKTDSINAFIGQVKYNDQGLVAAIAKDHNSGNVLMLAWQNEQSLQLTLQTMEMYYYSRSRKKLWHKGERSGHIQRVHRITMDCDGDAILADVEQLGGVTCHTGRASCFYRQFSADTGIIDNAPVIKNPREIYR